MEKENSLTKEEKDIFIKFFLSYSFDEDDSIKDLNESLDDNPINI